MDHFQLGLYPPSSLHNIQRHPLANFVVYSEITLNGKRNNYPQSSHNIVTLFQMCTIQFPLESSNVPYKNMPFI